MCWSLEVSLMSFVFSWAVGFYIWNRNYKYDRAFACALITFSSIQLLEGILWMDEMVRGLDRKSVVNNVVTKFFIPLVLSLEPLSILGGFGLVGEVDRGLLYGYVVVSILIFVSLFNEFDYSKKREHGLLWNSEMDKVYGVMFCFLLVLPVVLYLDDKIKYVVVSIIILALLLSFGSGMGWGSRWCLYGNLLALIFLFYPMI